MFYPKPIRGSSLPKGTLCLTYDDGPGEHTLRLARYLAKEGVPATFFVTGRDARRFPGVIGSLRGLGHAIGNHGYSHVDLGALHHFGGDVCEEVVSTARLIREGGEGPVMFRPPYGSWSPGVCEALKGDLEASLRNVGPIFWDVDTQDYQFWAKGRSAAECAARCVAELEGLKTGAIVLMHDSSADHEGLRQRNLTLAMTRVLVPRLKAKGYRFVELEDVPEVARAAARPLRVALRGSNGNFVRPRQGGGEVGVDGGKAIGWELVRGDSFRPGAVRLRAGGEGFVFAENHGGCGVRLGRRPAKGADALEMIEVGDRVAFRTNTGHYLSWEPFRGGSALLAPFRYMTHRAVFEVFLEKNKGRGRGDGK